MMGKEGGEKNFGVNGVGEKNLGVNGVGGGQLNC